MRQHLLQYGDILFLDAQNRQYDRLCCLYIGLIVKTNKNIISVVVGKIILNENISTYHWIIKPIVDMESNWDMKNLQIILADGLLTQSL